MGISSCSRRAFRCGEHDNRHLRNAVEAVARGARLANQLLSFARRQPLEPRAINLGRAIRGMDDLLRRALGEAVEIETIIAGGLWTTYVDPTKSRAPCST